MRVKSTIIGIGAAAVLVLAPAAASADELDGPDGARGAQVEHGQSEVRRGGVTYHEATATLVVPGSNNGGGGGITPNLVASGGGMTAEARLVNAGNGSQFWLSYARTRRTAGSGSYSTDVHAALNEYNTRSQWQSDPSNTSWQWGFFSAACASVSATNAQSQTCSSPQRSAGNKFYWSASGHHFDTATWHWAPTLDIYEQCTSGSCVVV